MAIASTVTGLALDKFADILQIHPLHFNQVQYQDAAMCGSPILQYGWQSADRTSREGIARAIADAENRIENYLGFPLAKRWITEEHTFTTQASLVQTYKKFARFGGVRASSLVSAAETIVYTDEELDGYDETATITFTTSVTEPTELHIYYPAKDGSEEYEIRNTKVTIENGTATIKFRREQCLLEKFLTPLIEVRAQDAQTDANFLEEVDVYRVYNDPSVQVEFMTYGMCAACGGDGCQACSYYLQTGCLRVVDPRNGLCAVTSGEWNTDTLSFNNSYMCSNPNKVRLHYYAGLGMTPEWERAVAYYALTLLDRPICDCSHLSGIGNIWKEDLALMEGFGGGVRKSPMADTIKACPLGTSRAAINAWRLIQTDAVAEAAIHA